MIPYGMNPFGLEELTTTFHIIKDGVEDTSRQVTVKDRLYCYATFPQAVQVEDGVYGIEWANQIASTQAEYDALPKYISKDYHGSGQKFMLGRTANRNNNHQDFYRQTFTPPGDALILVMDKSCMEARETDEIKMVDAIQLGISRMTNPTVYVFAQTNPSWYSDTRFYSNQWEVTALNGADLNAGLTTLISNYRTWKETQSGNPDLSKYIYDTGLSDYYWLILTNNITNPFYVGCYLRPTMWALPAAVKDFLAKVADGTFNKPMNAHFLCITSLAFNQWTSSMNSGPEVWDYTIDESTGYTTRDRDFGTTYDDVWGPGGWYFPPIGAGMDDDARDYFIRLNTNFANQGAAADIPISWSYSLNVNWPSWRSAGAWKKAAEAESQYEMNKWKTYESWYARWCGYVGGVIFKLEQDMPWPSRRYFTLTLHYKCYGNLTVEHIQGKDWPLDVKTKEEMEAWRRDKESGWTGQFVAWNTKNNGSGASWQAGQTVPEEPGFSNLYAQWQSS